MGHQAIHLHAKNMTHCSHPVSAALPPMMLRVNNLCQNGDSAFWSAQNAKPAGTVLCLLRLLLGPLMETGL